MVAVNLQKFQLSGYSGKSFRLENTALIAGGELKILYIPNQRRIRRARRGNGVLRADSQTTVWIKEAGESE